MLIGFYKYEIQIPDMNVKILLALMMFFILLLSSSAYALETNYTISTGASCGGSDENGDCTLMTDQDNATGWSFGASPSVLITFYYINLNTTATGSITNPIMILYWTQTDGYDGVNFDTSCYNLTSETWGSTIESYASPIEVSQDQIDFPESCIQDCIGVEECPNPGYWKIYMRITQDGGGAYAFNETYLRYTLTEEEAPPAVPLVLQVNSISPDNDTATTSHLPVFTYIANSTNATTLNTEVFIDYLNGTTSSVGSNASTLNGTVTELTAQYPLLFHGQLDWWVNVTQDDVSNVSERRRLTINDVPLVLQANLISPANNTMTTHHVPVFTYIANSSNSSTLSTEVFVDLFNNPRMQTIADSCSGVTNCALGSDNNNATQTNTIDFNGNIDYNFTLVGNTNDVIWTTYIDASDDSWFATFECQYANESWNNLSTYIFPIAISLQDQQIPSSCINNNHVHVRYVSTGIGGATYLIETKLDYRQLYSIGKNASTLNATTTELIANYPLLFHGAFDWWVNVTQDDITNKSDVRRMTIAPLVAEIIYPVNATFTLDTTPTATLRIIDGGNLSGRLYFINATNAYLVGSNDSMMNNTLTNITANFTLALGTYTVQFNATRLNGTIETDSVILTIFEIPIPPTPTPPTNYGIMTAQIPVFMALAVLLMTVIALIGAVKTELTTDKIISVFAIIILGVTFTVVAFALLI